MDKLTIITECAQLTTPMVVLMHGATTRRYHPTCAERSKWMAQYAPVGSVEIEDACTWHICDHCGGRFV